ncbi:hypothetical protein GCM10025859_59480 [Alicyclobacillus fastidiosus]|nr:hypothetical protein GCM10025859_00220 [Alicyclobacillus fastidiosus]GMA65508.1 hypothetical protein GCM10025859_59480 [Alicyclobacillus fastidiosus]
MCQFMSFDIAQNTMCHLQRVIVITTVDLFSKYVVGVSNDEIALFAGFIDSIAKQLAWTINGLFGYLWGDFMSSPPP